MRRASLCLRGADGLAQEDLDAFAAAAARTTPARSVAQWAVEVLRREAARRPAHRPRKVEPEQVVAAVAQRGDGPGAVREVAKELGITPHHVRRLRRGLTGE